MSTTRANYRAASVGPNSRDEETDDLLCLYCRQLIEQLIRSAPQFELECRSDPGDGAFFLHDTDFVDSSNVRSEAFGSIVSQDGDDPTDKQSVLNGADQIRTKKSWGLRPVKQFIFYHYDHWSLLVQSSENGCKLCYVLLESLRLQHFHSMDYPRDGPGFRDSELQQGLLEISWSFSAEEELSELCVIFKSVHDFTRYDRPKQMKMMTDLEVVTEDAHARRKLGIINRPIMSHANLCIPLIRKWLRICSDDHGSTCTPSNCYVPPLPSRVIDVNALEDSDDVRLCTSEGLSDRYIALSHCWGTKLPLRTTQASLEDRCARIPWLELPPSFRDAICVTRWLGIRYIWIDSLCIIQDSISDWAAESARMAAVYKNAFLTIASGCSSDNYGGMLLSRPDLPSSRIKTPAGFISIRAAIDRARPFAPENPTGGGLRRSYDRAPDYSDLTTRAWCFQEQFLAPRILYFTGPQLYWSCKSLAASEGSYTSSTPLDIVFKRQLRLHNTFDSSEPWRFWAAVVKEATRRKLTYGRDKLVCLAGIAEELQKLFRSEYLAGLWAHDLHTGLVWHLPYESDLVMEYRAPSWSWAAYDGPVSWGYDFVLDQRRGDPNDAEILGYNTELCDPRSPFGEVKDGYLELRATCGMAERETFRNPKGWAWKVEGWDHSHFDHSSIDLWPRKYYGGEFLLVLVSAWAKYNWDDHASKEVEVPCTAYLITEPVGEDVYQRVGLAWAKGRLPDECRWERRTIKIV